MSFPIRIMLVALAAFFVPRGVGLPSAAAGQLDLKSSAAAKFPKRTLFVFEGVVRDIEANPVPEARITVIPSAGGPQRWETIADAEGRFLTISDSVEEAVFFVSSPGYKSFQTRPKVANGAEVEIIVAKMFRVSGKVTDLESRAAIASFRIIPGESYGSNRPVAWHRSGQEAGIDGEYSFVANRRGGYVSVAIEADGYLPAESPSFKAPGWHEHDFALTKARGLKGRVLTPGGDSAGGARLVLAAPFERVKLNQSGRLVSEAPGFTEAGAEGEFEFVPRFHPDFVVAAHDSGYVRMPVGDVSSERPMRLHRWSRIEGALRSSVPASVLRTVHLRSKNADRQSIRQASSSLDVQYAAAPGSEGEFVFERVPPGEYELRVQYELKANGSSVEGSILPIVVTPGETLRTAIESAGRNVRGQLAVVGENPGEFDWRQADVRFVSKRPPPRAGLRNAQAFLFLVNQDGSFEILDVPEGDYELTVNLKGAPDERGVFEALGSIRKRIAVPKPPEENPEEPLKIGTLRVEIKKRGGTAPVAPVF